MKPKVFSFRLLVALIAWLALLMPTAKLKADNSPLCFTARNGSVTVRFDIRNVTHTIQYSTDSVTWNTYTPNTNVNLNANEKVYFRAESNQTTASAFYAYVSEHHISSSFKFSSSNNGKVEGSGNIMSLYGPDCPNLSLPQCAFRWMFEGCHLLTTAPSLPATTLAENCYYGMFAYCHSLTKAPELPATTLSSGCYKDMFDYCISLTTAPELPATTLAENCYFGMFRNCQSLTRAPELPATTISPMCYGEMFYGCTSLTTIPELPATIIGDLCYYQMFRNCTSLILNTTGPGKEWSIPAGATYDYGSPFGQWMFVGTGGNFTGTPIIGTTYYIASDPEYVPLNFKAKNGSVTVRFDIKNVTHTIQYSTDSVTWNTYTSNTNVLLNANEKVYFRAAANQTTATAFGNLYDSNSSRFYFSSADGGTVEASGNIMSLYGPDCPNIQLSQRAFAFLFDDCNLLTTAPVLPATTLDKYCYNHMFYGCTSLTAAPTLPATTLASTCYSSMFQGCTSLTAAPALLATTLASTCYSSMFQGCTSLTAAPALLATTLASSCYSYMFEGCTSLTAAPALPATTLANYCYTSMFSGCTSLTTAPALPATTLADYCYYYMFYGCTSLTTAPALPATTLASECYSAMFSGCTSLTATPALPTTTLADYCYSSMFSGCTSLTTAPALPATTLANDCYFAMFRGCTSLTATPALPATTLAYACYYEMFDGCTSLTTAPALPATTLASYCYKSMFDGCTSLAAAPTLPATTLADGCYYEMFKNCKSFMVNTTTPGTEWMIPATATANYALTNMFLGTSGTMNSTPSVNTTYYMSSCPLTQTIADGSWNDTDIWSGGNVPNSSNCVSILNNVTIPAGVDAECSVLSIEDGILTVVPTATLQIRILHNTDPTKLIIQSNQYNTATVHFSNGLPKATVQMCFKGTIHPNGGASNPDWQYRGFIGTPDSNQKLQDIVAFKWDEVLNASSCWGQNPYYNGCDHSATASFEPWTGYSMANYSSANTIREYTTTLTPTATPKSYTMSRTTVATGSSASENCGVNLLTNSYSAPINLSDPNITFNNAENTVYFFNTRTYNDYDNNRSAAITAYPTKSGYAIASTPYIPAGQSFAVKATADGATLTIPASAISAVSSGAMYAPAERKKFGIVKITVESDEAIDEVYLLQADECTSDFDNGYDGTKMFSTKAHQIYAQNEYGKTAVNADRTLLGQYVGFKPMNGVSANVTLWVSALDIEGYDELYLYDYVTDKYIEITDEESSYTFKSTGEENSRRFQIVGKAEDGTEYKPKAEPRIEVAGNEIYLMNFERAEAMVILSDATGRTLWSVNAKNGNVFTLPELAKGVYFVSCGKVSAKYVQR